jgi:DNA-binding response OmpR family regulator
MSREARSFSVTANNSILSGLRVLVVEDDYYVAAEICDALRASGAEIIGPSPDIAHGLHLVRSERIDCAVLDIELHGDLSFDLAHELKRRGTPSVFATGYDDSVLPREFSTSIYLEKPVNLDALLQAVQSLCSRPSPPVVESAW